MLHFLKYLFQLVISPGRGWEDIGADPTPQNTLARRGLFPLLIVAGLTVFVQAFYRTEVGFVELLCGALIIFVQYFISYYLAPIILAMALAGRTNGPLNERRLGMLALYGTAVMALVSVIENCVPIELSLVQFLPIYACIVLWKGIPLSGVKTTSIGLYIVTAILSIVCLPLLIGYLFSLAV